MNGFLKRILTTTSKFFKQELHFFPFCRIFVTGNIQWNKSTTKEKLTLFNGFKDKKLNERKSSKTQFLAFLIQISSPSKELTYQTCTTTKGYDKFLTEVFTLLQN